MSTQFLFKKFNALKNILLNNNFMKNRYSAKYILQTCFPKELIRIFSCFSASNALHLLDEKTGYLNSLMKIQISMPFYYPKLILHSTDDYNNNIIFFTNSISSAKARRITGSTSSEIYHKNSQIEGSIQSLNKGIKAEKELSQSSA